MYERFTSRARWVIEQAGHEAKRLEHDYIGTEHMLLALLEDHQGHCHRVLKQLLADQKRIAQQTAKLAERGSHNMAIGKLRQTPHVKNVLKIAREEAESRQLSQVGTTMLLLALLREEDGIAAHVLTQNKVNPRNVAATLQALSKGGVDLAHEETAEPTSLKNPWLIGGAAAAVGLLVLMGAAKLLGWW